MGAHPALRDLDAPSGRVTIRCASTAPEGEPSGGEWMRLDLAEGSVLDVRAAADGSYDATLAGGVTKTADDLVHPYLAPIAALVHRWRGVPAIHAGALVRSGKALALVAERGMGKTTTSARLLQDPSWSLISDDLVVVDGGRVLPGPLSLDLRPASAEVLGDLHGAVVRGGERVRHTVSDTVSETDPVLVGCVHLVFGVTTTLRTLPVDERLRRLGAQLYWPSLGVAPPTCSSSLPSRNTN